MVRFSQPSALRSTLGWILPIAAGVTVMSGTVLLLRPEGGWFLVAILLSGFVAGALAVLTKVGLGAFPGRPRNPFGRHRLSDGTIPAGE